MPKGAGTWDWALETPHSGSVGDGADRVDRRRWTWSIVDEGIFGKRNADRRYVVENRPASTIET
eukprot:8036349-Pyramimonas_sp.AAC.1